MSSLRLALLSLRARRARLLGLFAFGAVFLLAGTAAAVLLRGPDGDVHIDDLFIIGGYPLASSALLLGWLLGRLPLIATLVLMAGVVADDRRDSLGRLVAARPASRLAVYGWRAALLALVAFALCALVMPVFDLLLLGEWAGPATLVLIAAYVLVYGALTLLLSVWTRGDAWIALLLALLAMSWAALDRAGSLPVSPGARQLFGFLLPPQQQLFALENAFAAIEPIPWPAFWYAAGYALVLLILAGLSLLRREV